MMNPADQLTPHQAVNRLVSHLTANRLIKWITGKDERTTHDDEFRTICGCIGALMEFHPLQAEYLTASIEAVLFEGPQHTDDYVITLMNVVFEAGDRYDV